MHKITSFFIALAIITCISGVAGAAGPTPCPNAAAASDVSAPLPRLAGRLLTHQPIVIVAIGSSSTAGAGASAPQFSYPAQLQRELQRLWPDQPVKVVNRGINGEDAADMRRRFARDVFVEHPDLVVWQLGTNYLMRNNGLGTFAGEITQGVDDIRSRGIDVVLIGTPEPGFAVTPPPFYAAIAKEFRLPYEEGAIGEVLKDSALKSDPIHPNARGYRIIAERLAVTLKKSGAL